MREKPKLPNGGTIIYVVKDELCANLTNEQQQQKHEVWIEKNLLKRRANNAKARKHPIDSRRKFKKREPHSIITQDTTDSIAP